MKRYRGSVGLTLAALVLAVAGSVMTARAGAHSWRVSEAFSNADGSIWFVELWEYAGGGVERGISGGFIISVSTTGSVDIVSNVAGDTANKFVLFANPAFAALPGAPAPDQIVPGNAFFSFAAGERLRYSIAGQSFDLVIPAGGIPTNGIQSFNLGTGNATNSPTNYAGVVGQVDASGGGSGSGTVPLSLSKIVGATVDIVLSWGPSCASGDLGVGVYRGSLATLRSGVAPPLNYDHAAVACAVGGISTTLPEVAGNEYYLVVPSSASTEGSYGQSSIAGTTAERPTGSGACETQTITCP